MKDELVLILNCGSSSVKFAILHPAVGNTLVEGIIRRIGLAESDLHYVFGAKEVNHPLGHINYSQAIEEIIKTIRQSSDYLDNIVVVGHRVVHGGERFTSSVVIDSAVLDAIRAYQHLAPLHNLPNIAGIEAISRMFPDLPQVAVFDTAFHQTMPDYAYLYAVPDRLYKEYDVRRYGFHGTSHRFVTQEAAKLLNRSLNECAFVSAHLGNGCSAAAVKNGKSVDTTMGLTPLEGLMMGTRSGDIDPGFHAYMAEQLKCDVKEVTRILNHDSGLLGISGKTSDMCDLQKLADAGDMRAQLARAMFSYRLAKYVAALAVPLGRIDALIFTGGIGENDVGIRAEVLKWLNILGFKIDQKSNALHGKNNHAIITQKNSTVAMVIHTNEEFLIAQDAFALIRR